MIDQYDLERYTAKDRERLQDPKRETYLLLDACHIHEGGYDIVHNLDGVIDEFDRIVGLDRLKAIHLNDSKNPMGAHKDRHEKIGEGHIGIDAIARVVTHPKLTNLPFYLETPNELDGYAKEIAMLRSIVENK